MTIGDRIKQQRESKNMSQVELAEKIGVSKQTLYKYENNIVTNIPSIKLQSIAKVLEVSPAYLMGWENELADDTADLLPDLLSDKVFWENIKKLKQLNKEHQQTIFDNITYWYEKEGH
jgi:transcriptional regulator with XRE-family HTH domain